MKITINSITNLAWLIRFNFLNWFIKTFKNEIVNPLKKDGYKLTFNAEFKLFINFIDQWNLYYSNNTEILNDKIKHSSDCMKVEYEKLLLFTKQIDDPNFIVKSGYLCTKGKQSFKYGYFETRCKLPLRGKKFWPAFWLYGVNDWPPEIDIFEGMATKDIGGETTYFTMTNHFKKKNGKTMQGRRLGGLKLSQKYHTFGMLWTEKKIVWYLNNIPVYRLIKNVPQQEMCLVINIYGFKECTYKKNEKAVLKVDYVRAYKKQ